MKRRLIPAVVLLACTLGCREDMQDQPKYKPMAVSTFFADGRAARPVPPGAIAVDDIDQKPALSAGVVDGAFVTTIPVPVSVDLLNRGRDRYDIYCAPCHGRTGDGRGMVALRGFKIPADLSSDRVRNAPPGYLYAVITDGYGAMPDYSYQLDEHDRWAVVAYIRALELSRRTTLADAPPDARSRLEAQQ
ncbi:MAG TPA: cytochrome c [Terriglobia bacterium]|nr:cytochrome c [Terriglobia bacterium]